MSGSVPELTDRLAGVGYLADRGLATAAHVAKATGLDRKALYARALELK